MERQERTSDEAAMQGHGTINSGSLFLLLRFQRLRALQTWEVRLSKVTLCCRDSVRCPLAPSLLLGRGWAVSLRGH